MKTLDYEAAAPMLPADRAARRRQIVDRTVYVSVVTLLFACVLSPVLYLLVVLVVAAAVSS